MLEGAILAAYLHWPQHISKSQPIHTERTTSWLVSSNNRVRLRFLGKGIKNVRLFGYEDIKNGAVLPNEDGQFVVMINRNEAATLVVNPSGVAGGEYVD